MSGPLKQYFARSADILRRRTASALQANPIPSTEPLSIFSFDKPPVTPVSAFATGSDKDIGGVSTCDLTAVMGEVGASGEPVESHMAFHGNLSLFIPPEYRGRIRTGYAAFRNKSRPSIFGEDMWNLDLYSHLKIQVAYRGWEQWRNHWVCNIQTDGPVRSDVFQHRLTLPAEYATSENRPLNPATATGLNFATIYLPLSSFILTNSGRASETQISMMRTKVRTVGFALLGGGRSHDSPSDAQVESAQRGVRAGAGGWGIPKPNEEPDAELEELVESDLGASAKSISRGGYHRVGQAPVTRNAETADVATAEGYYELCVRSVEAVVYDPELD